MCSTRSEAAPTDLASAVATACDVADALTALTADGAWSQVASVSVAELTASLLRARDALGAVVTDGVGQVHSTGVLPDGHVSTKRWLEAEGLSAGAASGQLARVHALADFPRTRLAWLAGELTDDKVRAITMGAKAVCRGLTVPGAAAAREQLEAALLPFSVDATVAEISRRIARFRVVLDPDGVDAATLAAYDEQQLHLTPVGDGYDVRGYLAKDTAAVLLTVLDATVDGWYRSGDLDGMARVLGGDGTRAEDDDDRARRLRVRRRPYLHALALAEVCDRMLGMGELGTRHGVKPHVRVTVDAEEYRAGLGGHLDIPGFPAEPVTAATLDRILCDSDLTLVLTRPADSGGDRAGGGRPDWLREASREVLYVGRSARTAPPRLRAALETRDRHCSFPGCGVHASRCHAHHVTHWVHGGTTDIANMLLLCHGHHHQVHEGGWTITAHPERRPGETGYWQLAPPQRWP